VVFSSDLFTYNAKYLQTLPREKWRSFTNSLRSMLKLVHEVAWQFAKNLWMKLFGKLQCMKLLGNLTIWRAVAEWCLTGSSLQLLSG